MRSWIRLLRPHQWTKNVFCMAGVLFGGRMHEADSVVLDLWTVAVFCAASSAVYVFNDIWDRERDRRHPAKRSRPLASGAVSVRAAAAASVLLAVVGIGGALSLGPSVALCLVLYLGNNLAYTIWLKHRALLDVITIALGFCFRVLAGIYVLGDVPTTWIVLCTYFLALFLGFAKRRAELNLLVSEGAVMEDSVQRPVLSKYSVQFLDYLVNSAAVMVVLCYALFTTTSGKNPSLVLTVPIVFYAVMHYKRMVMLLDAGEDADRLLLKDVRLQASIVIFLASYFAIEYSGIQWFR